MTMAWISPSPAASEQLDLPSPRVGEDLCLRHCLDKSWEKYDVIFSRYTAVSIKEGTRRRSRAPRGQVARPAHLLGSLLTPWWLTLAHIVRLQKSGTWALSLINSESRSSWKVKNTKKEVFCFKKLNTDKKDYRKVPKII